MEYRKKPVLPPPLLSGVKPDRPYFAPCPPQGGEEEPCRLLPRNMFDRALKEGFAVGAFNVNNMEIIQGILQAGAEEDAPVILQVSAGARKYAGQNYIVRLVEAGLMESDLPVVLHLDHGADFEICKDCVDGGFTSVMIDGSHLPFEENIALTRRVVDYAHERGVWVEAELGRLAGVEEDVHAEHSVYTDPDQAVEFVRRSGCDSLAVAIGTSHGAYKFKGEAKLDFDRLKTIGDLLPGYPSSCTGRPACPRNLCAPAMSTAAMSPARQACPRIFCARPHPWPCARSISIRIFVWP